MKKLSAYNFTVQYQDNTIFYNGLWNNLLCFTADEYQGLTGLLDDLSLFKQKYPKLFSAFCSLNFIIDKEFDELEWLKIENKRCIYSNTEYEMTINPTLDCNVACWYCSVRAEKAKVVKTGMSDEVMQRIKKHILYKAKNERTSLFHISWFGGEPLMYYDSVIKPIAEFLAKNKDEFKFDIYHTITTNGTLLNEKIIKEMKTYRFSQFQITFDGCKERHDKIKSLPEISAYELTMKNINMIHSIIPDATLIVRINYDKQTLKNIDRIINDLPLNDKKNIYVDFQKVWQIKSTPNENQLLLKAKDIFNSHGYNSFFWAYSPKVFHRCYADKKNYIVINYDGKLFKCTARDYEKDKVIGEIKEDGSIKWNDIMMTKMYTNACFENELCLNCKMLPLCWGPCIQKKYEADASNEKVNCLLDGVEYKLDSYIIEQAKLRKLI